MSSSHALLRYIRLIHLYFGAFLAPAILFFAFTGALQTFSLHETTRGSSYKPPAWAVLLAQIHKKQTPIVPVRKLPPADKPTEKSAPQQASEDRLQPPSTTTPSQPTAKSDVPAPKPHN